MLAFATLLAMAALSDFRSYVIPNRLCVAILVLYPAHVLASSAPVDWVSGLTAGGIVFGVGLVMFAFRLAGGGDVKLMAAAGVWAGLEMLPMMLLLVVDRGRLLQPFRGHTAAISAADLAANNEAGSGSADRRQGFRALRRGDLHWRYLRRSYSVHFEFLIGRE